MGVTTVTIVVVALAVAALMKRGDPQHDWTPPATLSTVTCMGFVEFSYFVASDSTAILMLSPPIR